jgi:hypothetical protein
MHVIIDCWREILAQWVLIGGHEKEIWPMTKLNSFQEWWLRSMDSVRGVQGRAVSRLLSLSQSVWDLRKGPYDRRKGDILTGQRPRHQGSLVTKVEASLWFVALVNMVRLPQRNPPSPSKSFENVSRERHDMQDIVVSTQSWKVTLSAIRIRGWLVKNCSVATPKWIFPAASMDDGLSRCFDARYKVGSRFACLAPVPAV